MKTLTVATTGQYASSNSLFEGTKKQVVNFLRCEAKRMRRESRVSRHLSDDVHALPVNAHSSKLVTMASFKLNSLNIDSLLDLINNHGVLKYQIV